MASINRRSVRGKKDLVFEAYLFNESNGAGLVQFFLNRGEHADNYGSHLTWNDPDTGVSSILFPGDRVLVVNDKVYFMKDELFKALFETAK